ncbi:MAG TPA: serine hydrolase [Novosphingobium sp.]|nr:serine hydrolase [Novosphingobium sp.]
MLGIGRKQLSLGFAALAMLAAPLHGQAANAGDGSPGGSSAAYASGYQQPSFAAQSLDRSLEAQLRSIVADARGRIGVYAAEIGGSRAVSLNADQAFPMASTVKIAIAATYLQGVDEGRLRLDSSYPLRVGTGKTGQDGRIVTRPGMSLTAQSLIELSLTRSDNQATDALLHAVGGTAAVNRWLAQARIDGQRVDRDIATLLRDDLEKNDPALGLDKRDSSTPAAMAHLLGALHRGEVLSAQSRAVLLGAMSRCQTGKTRIPALLPAGTLVAHKTGTLFSQTSDVGIIRLPDGRSVALAVFVTGPESHALQGRQIASIARAVYDSFAGSSGYEGSQVARR